MKRAIFLSAVAASGLLAPVLISAQTQDTPPNPPSFRRQGPGPGPGSGPGAPGRPRPSLKDQLGLTEAQQTDLRKATENARRDRLRKSTDLRIARMDLRSLLRDEKVDEKAVAARLAEASAAQTALLKLRVDSVLAMKRILTPEQQKKFAELRADRGRQRMGQRPRGMGRRMGPQGPGPGDLDDDLELDLEDIDGY